MADGVGGGPAGDLASAAIVHRLAAGRLAVADADALERAVRGANWDLWAYTQRHPSLVGMATTLTGLVISTRGQVLIAHSGDSRAYRLRAGVLTRQTRDDSLVQALVDYGVIEPGAAATHPRRNIVTASLGGGDDDGLTVGLADAAVGDRWLLCSDGISDYLPAAEILEAASTGSPSSAARAVVSRALEAGTRDNVTAVICDVLAEAPKRREEPVFHGAASTRFLERIDDAS